jgi:hypothetical protein
MHDIEVGTYVFHDACDERSGAATAKVNETKDLNKMVHCFNCGERIYINETFWEDPIFYDTTEIQEVGTHIPTEGMTKIFEIPQKWIIIDAPTGTGKTTVVEEQLKLYPQAKVLAIAKFTTLVRNLSQRFGLVFYKAADNLYRKPTERYACTLDHVCTLINQEWDYIILDEASMTRGHSTSHTIQDR